ncbi:RHS repeat-associated core domain-containing protein [Dokdonella immobilis]|uniref:RHS repeat-associated core domain-containing protein n=2 Tax=Dokdonella immobilis TaxID=578942 RepID=A0A1I4Z665_9GAMM|nr:RHS repeat-associated core domain-containing protein [Dokdonella immobilis]
MERPYWTRVRRFCASTSFGAVFFFLAIAISLWCITATASTTLIGIGFGDQPVDLGDSMPPIPQSVLPTITSPPNRDGTSDSVGATVGEFRVDEGGNANYSVPIQVTPGVAGMVPKIALAYNSRIPAGVMGPGWAIEGTSQIARCRQTRESGDFMDGTTPIDGNPSPINFTSSDRLCLDGIRLLVTFGAYWDGNAVYSPENDPFTRVTTSSLGFTVQRKDGTTSTYGDTVVSPNSRPSIINGFSAVPVGWYLSRVQDTAGNYINYLYYNQPAATTYAFAAGAFETVLAKIEYTGHASSPTLSPYASVSFQYNTLSAARVRLGYQRNVAFVQSQQLASITVTDATNSSGNSTIRFYKLTYSTSASGSDAQELTSLKECRDSTETVCFPPTQFSWSTAIHQFVSETVQNFTSPTFVGLVGYKLADVDGDGRQDVVWARNGDSCGSNSRIYVSFLDRTATNTMTLVTPNQAVKCASRNLLNDDQSWQVLDYDGDNRADLLIAGVVGGSWQLFLGAGRPTSGGAVFGATNQLASLSPAIPVLSGPTRHPGVLTDLNGDGSPDFVYPVTPSAATGDVSINVRLLQRDSATGTYAFSAPYAVDISFLPTDACRALLTTCSLDFFRQQGGLSTPAIDLNADGRGDLTFIVFQSCPGNPCPTNTGAPLAPVFDADLGSGQAPNGPSGGFTRFAWYQFTSDGTRPPNAGSSIPRISLTQHWTENTTLSAGELPYDPALLYLADVNGDGLMDIVYQDKTTMTTYWTKLATGLPSNPSSFPATSAYKAAISVTGIANGKYLQLIDINGDGRTDYVYPTASSSVYSTRTLLSDGTFTAATAVPGGGLTSGSTLDQWVNLIGEFDGDGAADFIRFNVVTSSSNLYTSRAASTSRYKPRDVITTITNGHGAQTQLTYQPLTNKGIYQRGMAGGALARILNYGWNSPVFDVLAPMYVVSKAASSAPVKGNASALSTVYYRYQGAQVQAGGRGYLGFNVVWTFDDNHGLSPNQYVVTRTGYTQNYPFIGMPVETHTLAVTGPLSYGSADLDACSVNPETTSYNCFAPVGATGWPDLLDDGVLVGYGGNQPLCKGDGCLTDPSNGYCEAYEPTQPLPNGITEGFFTPPAIAAPIFTYIYHDLSMQFDLESGSPGVANRVQTNQTINSYCYEDNYGNLTRSRTVTWSSAEDSAHYVAQKLSTNTYDNDPSAWILGRLRQSDVEFRRPGVPTISRKSNFVYDATTGILTSERVQQGGPAAMDLRTVYKIDDFGNRVGAYQCSADRGTDTQCKTINSSFRQRPDDGTGHSGTRVHRYALTNYDSRGRYVSESRLPFYTASGTTHLNEQTALSTTVRDEFGNGIVQLSANGLTQTSRFGAMGRPYFTSDSTGMASTTTYRQCTAVSCPSDAKFRSQTIKVGAPTSWTYFDVLGRPIMGTTQSFDANPASQTYAAVCSYYDAHGRASWKSEPFFPPATVSTDGSPTFTSSTPCDSASASTTTEYDVLGRVTKITNPDGGTVTKSYLGLTTFTTNPRGFTWEESKNALGEIIETRDPTVTGDANVGVIVNQTYDALGNVLTLSRDGGHGVITTTITYDALGRKLTIIDPDAGTIQYFYNPAGEVIRQIDNKNQTVTNDYDALGRRWSRTAPGTDGNTLNDAWTYDTAVNGLGQLASESRQSTTGVTFSRTTSFDAYGRLQQRSTSIAGNAYTETTAYDSFGRLMSQQDASGETLTSNYSSRGHLESLDDSRAGRIYEVLRQTSRGQVASDKRGNSANLLSTLTYDPATGRLNTVCSGNASCSLQDYRYAFDLAGNVTERERSRTFQPTTETFTYDALNRLTFARLTKISGVIQSTPITTALITYDKLGNVCTKNGTTYGYSGPAGCTTFATSGRPHAVTTVGAVGFTYDGNGSQTTSTNGRTLAYDALNELASATLGTNQTTFQYSPSGDRFLSGDSGTATWPASCAPTSDRIFCDGFEGGGSPATSRITHYVGNVEIVRVNGVITEKRRYLGGVALDLIHPGGTNQTRYTFGDHLGSVDIIASATGALVEALSFDAHGSRRNPTTWLGGAGIPSTTPRGFTGHEHFDTFGFIHMNGRTYDPATGRMLQADPLMDGSAQGLNRYTYVTNNPLALTDPTGYSAWGGIIRAAVAIVIVIYAPYLAPYLGNSMLAAYAVAGFAAGVVTTGTLQGGLYGAFSAMLFYGIGQQFANAGSWATEGNQVFGTNLNMVGYSAKVIEHGVAGGVMSSLQGGKFGNGFASAGVTQAFSGAIDRIDPQNPVGVRVSANRVIAAAMVGGTASVVGGGKFANGALTGAFSRAFNDESAKMRKPYRILGVHSNAEPGDTSAGHGWITLSDPNGVEPTKSYSIFEDGFADNINDPNHEYSDVMTNTEINRNYVAKYSAYFALSEEQTLSLNSFIAQNQTWSYVYNCTTWVDHAVQAATGYLPYTRVYTPGTVWLGMQYGQFGVDTPGGLASAIQRANKANSQ